VATAPREFVQGQYYHVYNRGNHKEVIFRDNFDRRYFLARLDEYCERDGLTLVAYCLMDNHFHLLVRQDGDRPVGAAMRSLLAGYVRVFNQKYGLVGRLFQERFQARLVGDEAYLMHLSRYIHVNPAQFEDFRRYRWSSYREYAERRPGLCDPGPVLDLLSGSGTSYTTFCEMLASPGEASDRAMG
jgi:putative transposase